jgi:hypothetical protein
MILHTSPYLLSTRLSHLEMEIIPEGKNFRLLNDDELPRILETLEKHLPYSLKVRCTNHTHTHNKNQFLFRHLSFCNYTLGGVTRTSFHVTTSKKEKKWISIFFIVHTPSSVPTSAIHYCSFYIRKSLFFIN